MGTHIAKFATSFQRDFPELRGGRKKGKKTEENKKGAPPRAPTKAQAPRPGQGGRREAESKNSIARTKIMAGSGQGASHAVPVYECAMH